MENTLFYISGQMRFIAEAFNKITLKRYVVSVLLITAVFHVAKAQRQMAPPARYLTVEPDKTHFDPITRETAGKVTTITTMSGYVKVNIDQDGVLMNGWYMQAYYHQIGYAESDRTEETISNLQGGSVYLSSGTELIFNITDLEKDTLISRYIVKRPRKFAIVNFYHFDKDGDKDFYTLRAGYSNILSMSPGTLDLRESGALGAHPLAVDYLLINNRTKQQQRGRTRTGYVTFVLEPSTVYKLRVNYADQPENVTEAIFYVKPYWYQSRKTYVILGIGLMVIAFVLVVIKFKDKIRSSKKENKQLEQSAIRLRSQLNPHFTFNALSSVQGLMNTGRIEEANTYLEEFGSLLRKTLVKSNEVFNSLDQELEMMRAYIRLEALRFNFQWEIQVSDDIDRSGIEIPTLILQPLIENAIKHGLSSLGDEGHLLVSCVGTGEKDTFAILIKDNGTWIARESGYGLSLTADLIKAVNELKTDGHISMQVLKTTGTTVILTFHNWMNN